jgi:hypothetical protein
MKVQRVCSYTSIALRSSFLFRQQAVVFTKLQPSPANSIQQYYLVFMADRLPIGVVRS